MAKTMNLEYIELRLDSIKNINNTMAIDLIDQIKNETDIPIILTNRTKCEGGIYTKSEDERIDLLVTCAPLVEYTDIELSTDSSLRSKVISSANNTIISYHNFSKTPSIEQLQVIIDEAHSIGDIAKIALKPQRIEDTYTILKLLMDNNDLIAISMDELGKYTRIVAPLMGSPVTYAAIKTNSAPGQLDVTKTSNIIKELKPDKNE
ncbi:MAG: type I 3-dehydroquinate dehydratase [Methanosphaera sp.]|nr:type I 3-dehydroquinate dehydratase [Methanosphaera sp.]